MNQTANFDSRRLMKRLWKGALHVLAVASYIALIIGMLVIGNWIAGFVTLGLVLLAQSLRYVASAMDRIAHSIGKQAQDEENQSRSSSSPIVSAILVWLLIQGCNVAIGLYAMNLDGTQAALRVLAILVFVEAIYLGLRMINRRIAYEPASFGIADKNLLHEGPVPFENLDERAKKRIEQRLEVLKNLAADGDISQRAYLRARDKYLVRYVMESKSDEVEIGKFN